MHLTMPQEALNSLLRAAGGAIAANPTHPILRGVLLRTGEGSLTATGYDGATGVQATSEALVEAPGALVAPHRLLSDLVGRLPALAVTLRQEGATLHVGCGAGEYRVPLEGEDVEDYPVLPAPSGGTTELAFEPFARALAIVNGFAAKEADKVQSVLFRGVAIARKGEDLTLTVGGQGGGASMFALASLPGVAVGEGLGDCVVPLAAIQDLRRLEDEAVDVSSSDNLIQFSGGGIVITAGLLAGAYPPIRKALPKKYACEVAFDRDSLRAAVERVSLFSGLDRTTLVLEVGDVECIVRAEAGGGKGVDVVGCLGGPETPLVIGFDGKFLTQILRACPSKDVKLLATDSEAPTLWRADELTEFVLMPMKVAG